MKYDHVRAHVYKVVTNYLHVNVYLPAGHACAACEHMHASAVLMFCLPP